MLNIEQELEISHSVYELRNPRYDTGYDGREIIRADLYRRGYFEDSYSFDRKTGVMIGQEESDTPLRIRPKSQTRAIDHFYLFAGMRDWSKESWVKLPQEHFHDGASAAERMKQHNGLASTALSPFRFMVKKEVELSPIRDYASWAEFRFGSGDWERVPWADEPWANTEATAHHFVHISKEDDSQVAFWYSEADACRDAPTTMTPGRYLQHYYGEVLSPTEIRDWAVKVDAEAVLKFAHTPDEIYEIYNEENGGPSSCMRYADHSTCNDGVVWRSGINPVRVYGAGDLALAYITRKGKVAARALVWPEKMIAGRRYGDTQRLDAILKEAGYKLDHEESNMYARGKGGFNGARLLKIEPEDHPGNYVMPYLDYGYKFDVGEEYLTLNMLGAHSAQRTDGLAFEPEDEHEDEFCCAGCSEYFDDDDANSLNDSVYCDDCYSERTNRCDRCHTTDHRDNFYTVNDHEDWCYSCYSNHAVSCDYCDESYDSGRLMTVYDARYEAVDDADHHADACSTCYDERDAIQHDVNGTVIDTSTATTCEDCGAHFSGHLNEEDCPTQSCVERRAAEANTEMENA